MGEPRVSLQPAGQLVDGRYRIEEVIGRGGMAAVYRALDGKSGRKIALKRVWSKDAKSAHRRNMLLEREYYTLAQLAHPRIIEVYAFGVDADGPYYTMELLDGDDLASARMLPWPRACALLVDVASSLAILHSRGLLHRDVSARNVRCGADGRAKLIDFGALTSLGFSLDVVGTPPFVAPEAVQMQALDGRADLFSLGALGYYILTGRHAFPARKLAELRDVWRSVPAPLTRLLPDVPPALNALVMQLLALDRSARPHSAAEVMQRLCAIADLPVQEDVEVSRAYLSAPVLVGRERAQLAARKCMLSLVRGESALLLIEGEKGAGRTRMLDACVLDARLLGAQVARADASLGSEGAFGVAHALCRQLLEIFPNEAREALRHVEAPVAALLEQREPRLAGRAPVADEQSLLIRGLRDVVLAIVRARGSRVLLAIDDVDCIDEASLAFLAALASKTERYPLGIVFAVDSDSRTQESSSLRLLYSLSERIALSPLTAAETEQLLRSVFGETAQLSLVAARVHALSQGLPRASMELADHLVQRGLARYEAGTWTLSAEISPRDLPESMAASLLARVAALDDDAQLLAQLTAVAEQAALLGPQYEQLCPTWSRARLFRALHELVAARVLVAHGDHYAFTQSGFVSVLCAALQPERARDVHGRYADLLETQGADLLLRASHLLAAGRGEQSIDLLLQLDFSVRHPPLALLSRALEFGMQRGLPESKLREIRVGMCSASVFALDVVSFRRWSAAALARLEQESGLAAYAELCHVPAEQRLAQALTVTHQRYLDTPEAQRGFGWQEAIRRLARLANAFAVMAIWTFDLAPLEAFPSLEPLYPLSPAVSLVSGVMRGARAWVTGQYDLSAQIYRELLVRLAEPDRAGLDESQCALMSNSCHQLLGMLMAPAGHPGAEEHARVLEGDRAFRVNAWRIRQMYHFSQGDLNEARRCMRRAELLKAQEGLDKQASAGGQAFELIANIQVGDVVGVRAALEAVEALSQRLPQWRAIYLFGQSHYRALQGDNEAALAFALEGLELAPLGRHSMFTLLASARINALTRLGRAAEAVEVGRDYLTQLDVQRLPYRGLNLSFALALAQVGETQEAAEIAHNAIDVRLRAGFSGVELGRCYEVAARVALAANDQAAFERAFAGCAQEFKKGHNSALAARVAALLEAARHKAFVVTELHPTLREFSDVAESRSEYITLHSRLDECLDRGERARCALSLVLQQAERYSGALYGAEPLGLSALASLPEAPEAALGEWVATWFAQQLERGSGVTTERVSSAPKQRAQAASESTTAESAEITCSDASGAAPSVASRWHSAEGRDYEPFLLVDSTQPEPQCVGVLVLQVVAGPRALPDPRLLGQIATALAVRGDVIGPNGVIDPSMRPQRRV